MTDKEVSNLIEHLHEIAKLAPDVARDKITKENRMKNIGLVEVNPNDDKLASTIQSWFKNDIAGSESMGFYSNPKKWFSLFNVHRHGLVITRDDEPAGFIDIQIINDTEAHIAYYVAPSFRKIGIGKQALHQLEAVLSKNPKIDTIYAFVEPDNVGSSSLLLSLGYDARTINEEQMIPYRKSLRPII